GEAEVARCALPEPEPLVAARDLLYGPEREGARIEGIGPAAAVALLQQPDVRAGQVGRSRSEEALEDLRVGSPCPLPSEPGIRQELLDVHSPLRVDRSKLPRPSRG